MTCTRHSLCVALVLTLGAAGALAQDKKIVERTPGDEMIEKYLAAETDKLSKKFVDGARTLEEWQKKRPRLYREYMDMLGLWPLPEKTPLKATVTGQVEGHGVVVEKLHFQSKPGLYVTANFYRPKVNDKKLPTVLYVCGHSGRGRDGNKTAFQDHGFWFANNGYNCLVLDTLQLGEIAGIHHGTYGLRGGKGDASTRMWWHSAGYTPAGVECWNGVRAVDYLVTRPDVDPDRLGVTGISGGGAATFWIAAADERLKVAVPVSGMSDLESYVKNKVINGHCDCMFLYNTHQWEWTTIAAMIAPRPMLFANSDNDPIFPMDGNRRIIERLRHCYKLHGKPGLVDEYVSEGGHAYRPDLRVAIFKFLNKHLKGDATSPVEDSAKYTELPGKELRVFPTDDDLPKDALNARIDETFVPRAKVELPAEGKFAEWKAALMKQLKERSFKPLAERVPAAKLVKAGPAGTEHPNTEANILLTGGPEVVGIYSPDVKYLFVVDSDIVKRGTKSIAEVADLRKKTWTVWPRGVEEGRFEWSRKSPPNYVERAHVLVGRTIDGGRVHDVAAVHNRIRDGERSTPAVVGIGTAGIVAAYAALFEPSIKEVIVIDPPKSHMEGPHFLGVLRVLDVPEALGLLAPTPLTIVGGDDAAFERTAAIYRAAGAADKLVRRK